MHLGLARHCIAFEHFLDEINTPARPVQLITQQLIGGTRGVAETAVHAGAQNTVSLLAVRGIFYGISELGLHFWLVFVLFFKGIVLLRVAWWVCNLPPTLMHILYITNLHTFVLD